jgi:hypothetical protein
MESGTVTVLVGTHLEHSIAVTGALISAQATARSSPHLARSSIASSNAAVYRARASWTAQFRLPARSRSSTQMAATTRASLSATKDTATACAYTLMAVDTRACGMRMKELVEHR